MGEVGLPAEVAICEELISDGHALYPDGIEIVSVASVGEKVDFAVITSGGERGEGESFPAFYSDKKEAIDLLKEKMREMMCGKSRAFVRQGPWVKTVTTKLMDSEGRVIDKSNAYVAYVRMGVL